MRGSVAVRAATTEDIPHMLAAAASSAFASQWEPERYWQMLSAPADAALQYAVLVAVLDGQVVGFAAASAVVAVAPAEAELENLAVLPAAQGRGMGGVLMQAVLAWAAALGAGLVRLEVRSANTAALRLYRRHGFVQIGVRKGYYAAPVDNAICMERRLP